MDNQKMNIEKERSYKMKIKKEAKDGRYRWALSDARREEQAHDFQDEN